MSAIRNVAVLAMLCMAGCYGSGTGENAVFQASVYASDDGQVHVALFHWNSDIDLRHIRLEHIALLNRQNSNVDPKCDTNLYLDSADSDWLSTQGIQRNGWAVWDIPLPANPYLIKHCKAVLAIEIDPHQLSGHSDPIVVISTDLTPGAHSVSHMRPSESRLLATRLPDAAARSTRVFFTENVYRVEILLPESREETKWNVESIYLNCGATEAQLLTPEKKGPGIILAKGQWGALVREIRADHVSEDCEWSASLSQRQESELRPLVLRWAASTKETFSRLPTIY